jgi:hypothetical protein
MRSVAELLAKIGSLWPSREIGFSMVVMGQRVCPLCQTTKHLEDFRKSHFMPASLYHSGKKGLQYGTRSGTGRVERDIKDLLLCSACEGVLARGDESYVLSQIAAKVMKEFPLHRMLSVALPRESYPDISRFSGDDLGIDYQDSRFLALMEHCCTGKLRRINNLSAKNAISALRSTKRRIRCVDV